MKKLLLSLLLAVSTFVSLFAVPRGMYCDDRGKNQVLVSDNGDIHFIDNYGNVTRTLSVIKENSDGSFTTKDMATGIIHYNNCYWYENGVLYLNLEFKRVTLHRQ